ncbi:MAG: hypothetical protein FWB73_00670 [Treponema sp.]|nr:hypothetical protein [Treponema sp.]
MKRIKLILISLFIISAFSSCFQTSTGAIEREELFSLEIGPMEDQIALYRLDGSRGIKRTGFTMRDGLFFISDGNSGKIVRYNTYGDLLFMIYNEEKNPPPHTLRTNISEEEQSTRWAFTYPLEEPGWIAVDSRKHIFVEDRLPHGEHMIDTETKSLLDGLILHFDQNGRFINYLGREGVGGSPFPRIVGLSTSIRDELAVICRIPDGWDVYWFNTSGMLLYLVKISSNEIPALSDLPDALAIIDAISTAIDDRKLYIKVDYSRDTFDQSTMARTGSEPVSSCIWTLDVENGTYLAANEIPLYEITENNRSITYKVFYSMLGTTENGKAILYVPVDNGYSLLFADMKTREQRRNNIRFSNEELGFNDFFLSAEGILCAMLADNFNVKLVWWRTDQFMSSYF